MLAALRSLRWSVKGDLDRRRYERHMRRSMSVDAPLFAYDSRLPAGYGRGLAERAVEFGWALAQAPSGSVLDAGSTFNHPFALDALLPRVERLTITTLAPEPMSYPERGVTYLYEDLRELACADDTYDNVLCVSVLEHIGMCNTKYGVDAPAVADPQQEALRAMRELARVTRSGGSILLTVPYGLPEDNGWMRAFDEGSLADLIEASGAGHHLTWCYRDTHAGWMRTTLSDASVARLRTYHAGAVACVRLDL